jgi:hypothetical protein
MDDEFATSAIVALSSFNYYYEGPCRAYLMQALKSSCTVIINDSSMSDRDQILICVL